MHLTNGRAADLRRKAFKTDIKEKGNYMSKLERFEVLLKEGSSLSEAGQTMILCDKETGVQYLWVKSGYAGGLTPLLDAEGKPLIAL